MTIDVGGPINAPGAPIAIGGVTLSEFRQRLRIQLSSYAANTLISSTNPDTEAQFINDGIGQLWPWDFQIVNRSILVTAATQRYAMPVDCEHVFSVGYADKDINEPKATIQRIPAGDGWQFDPALIDASTTLLEDGSTWDDSVRKYLTVELWQLGLNTNSNQSSNTSQRYLVVRYARRWPALTTETEAVDPSPGRVQAVIHFAASEWFTSQFQVNSESIRYSNYLQLSQREYQLAQQNLMRDPKSLYTV